MSDPLDELLEQINSRLIENAKTRGIKVQKLKRTQTGKQEVQ
jgi:hypothetical protein